MNRRFLGRALVLGLLSAIGPFAIDMYLPALPAIGAALHADVAAVQWSLMAFFIAFALSQLVYGPASDIFGRKHPLYVGIALFIVGSIGCALAPDIGWLIAWRCVQGLGGGAPIVVPRAIVRDLHTGAEATRLMAIADAGLQRLASAGAAGRQLRHRGGRLARDLLGDQPAWAWRGWRW